MEEVQERGKSLNDTRPVFTIVRNLPKEAESKWLVVGLFYSRYEVGARSILVWALNGEEAVIKGVKAILEKDISTRDKLKGQFRATKLQVFPDGDILMATEGAYFE